MSQKSGRGNYLTNLKSARTVDILLISPFITKKFPNDWFTLLICEKNVANYALLRCKTFSLKIRLWTNIMSVNHLSAVELLLNTLPPNHSQKLQKSVFMISILVESVGSCDPNFRSRPEYVQDCRWHRRGNTEG